MHAALPRAPAHSLAVAALAFEGLEGAGAIPLRRGAKALELGEAQAVLHDRLVAEPSVHSRRPGVVL